MKILNIVCGAIGTNCYVLYEPKEAECIVIDPGGEPDVILRRLESLRVVPKYMLATHGHPDHVGAIRELKNVFPEATVMIHEGDLGQLRSPWVRNHPLESVEMPLCDAFYQDGDELRCGSMTLKVLHTPGHSPGGVSLVPEGGDCVFAGDTLFRASVGRSDFPGGNFQDLVASIRDKLYKLPPETVVYPGHGSATRIGDEMEDNPFVRAGAADRDGMYD